ncbi:MAG: hypothetical protein V3W11_04365 [bacterium]
MTGIYQRISSYFGRTFVGFVVVTVILVACLVKYQEFFVHMTYIWLATLGVLAGKSGIQNVTAIVKAKTGGKQT